MLTPDVHPYRPECECQHCWDHRHECDVCRGCELKTGCQTMPNFGCMAEERARRGRTRACRVCGDQTPVVFNIRLKAVPICQACASAITKQEVAAR